MKQIQMTFFTNSLKYRLLSRYLGSEIYKKFHDDLRYILNQNITFVSTLIKPRIRTR